MNKYFKRTKKKVTIGYNDNITDVQNSGWYTHHMLKLDGTHADLIIGETDTKFITREGNDVSHLVPYLVETINKWPYRESYRGAYACELIHLDRVLEDPKDSWNASRRVLGCKEFNQDEQQIQCVIYDLYEKEYIKVDQGDYLERRLQLPAWDTESTNMYAGIADPCYDLPNFYVPVIHPIFTLEADWKHHVTALGREGMMLFDVTKSYAWDKTFTKVKPLIDVDCVVMGFNEGTKGTKNEGRVGSINVGVYRDGQLVNIGKVPHMTESQRNFWTDFEAYTADHCIDYEEVIQVEASELTAGGKLRFPNYVRRRTDKKAEECTWEQLL